MNNTNNDIMWDCMVAIFRKQPMDVRTKVINFIVDYHVNEGKEVNNNFSIDNWQVVTCYCRIYVKSWMHQIPLIGHHTKHPMKFIEMAWMLYPWLFFLKPLTILDMAVRHLIIRRKTASGEYHTSGLLLDFYVFYSFEARVMMFILTLMMRTMFKDWEEVFRIYHGNPTHYNHKVYLAYKRTLN